MQSVVDQKYENLEYLILDGESTDNTLSIVRSYQDRVPFIRLYSQKDNGIYDAMNNGLNLASGDWLFFLGGDDVFASDHILNDIFTKQADLVSVDLIYGKVKFKHCGILYGGETDLVTMMKNRRNICHQGIFYSRKVFDVVGIYDLKYPIYADFDLNIRCFRNRNISKKYIDMTIAIFNEEGRSKGGKLIDHFYSELITRYVREFENPVKLFLDNEELVGEISALKESKEYRIGKILISPLRTIKRWIQ